MRAVILLGHGSRVPDAARDMERVAEGLRSAGVCDRVEACHMAMLGPNFPETFEKCVRAGATEVLVIPYFLHLGQHMREDIPRILQAEAAKAPQVRVVLGKHLGFDPVLVDLVARRVSESAGMPDVRQIEAPNDDEK